MASGKVTKFVPFIVILLLTTIFISACSSQAKITTDPTPTELPEPTEITFIEPTIEITDTPVSEPTPKPLSIIDGLGREVTLAEPAQRVVSLAPSNTEILFAVAAGEQVVGRDEFSDYPEDASSLPSVGGGFGDYNLEAIVDMQPDLVLAAEINTPEQVKAIEDLGLTVYLLPNPTTLEEMYGNLLTCLLYTSPSPRDATLSRMPSSA